MLSGRYSALLSLLVFFNLWSLFSQANSSSSDDVLYVIFPFIKVYKDGRIERFIGKDVVPASIDPRTGVQSKDIKIARDVNLSARIYLPKNANPVHKIPLLIYFHGGGFFTESAFSPTYHNHLNSVVAKANIIAVSVNYRLAPEHPLPTAYQDSWLAVNWVFNHNHFTGNYNIGNEEVWLTRYADFGRVYLGGDSAGGNIAHQMAMRIGQMDPAGIITIKGMFLNCPYFWGKRLIGNESADANERNTIEALWLHAYPNSSGLDDPLVNPAMDPNLKNLGSKRVLVYVAGNDGLKFRGWFYMQVLKKSGWNGIVKVVEVGGEGHDFNLINPTTPKAMRMLKSLAYFLNP